MAPRFAPVAPLLLAALLALDSSFAVAADAPPAAVVVNGQDESVDVVALEGDGAAPREDDILAIGPGMMRGRAAKLRLRSDQGRWFEIGDDGKETLVGLCVSSGNTIAARLLPPDDALAIPETAFASLRGIAFEYWDDRFAPMLRGIDASRCFVNLSVGLQRKVPALPDGLRALRIEGFLDDPLDLRPLADETHLRRLVVDQANVSDWSPLAGLRELVHLEAAIRADAAATVPALPSLRSWSASYDDDVTDLSFVTRFPALEVLDVHGTGVTDLSLIARLTAIREVDATMSAVAKLPSGKVPSLRKLRILRHEIPAAELRAFIDANPQCETDHSWRARLDARIAGVDGVRLRTGGQCHRDEVEEDTLFASQDPKDLRELLAAIAIDEPASRGHCMCCGGPTIELLRGGEIAASLTIHHDQALRFGGWPGDGRLTEDAADALCAWLTKHGAPAESPRAKAKREAAEANARDAAQDVLLGAERGKALRACTCPADLEKIARAVAPETDARIVLLLRLSALRGGPRDGWGRDVADHAQATLRDEDAARLATVLLATLTDPATPRDLAVAAAEAVRDLDDDRSPLSKETLLGLRIPTARVFIAHLARGDRIGHERLIDLLRKQATPEATALAMSLLPAAGKDGRPVAQPRREEMELASRIVVFCEEKDLPRIRALAAASRDPKRWSAEIEEQIERRRKREAASAAPR